MVYILLHIRHNLDTEWKTFCLENIYKIEGIYWVFVFDWFYSLAEESLDFSHLEKMKEVTISIIDILF